MSNLIGVQVDNTQLLLRMRNGQKRLAYAVEYAINDTAKRVQKAEFENVRRKFTVRKPNFFFGTPTRPGGAAARIKPFARAKENRLYSEVFIARTSELRSQRRLVLALFEAGGTKSSSLGATGVAIPITGGPARPTFRQPVDPKFTFAKMNLVAHRSGKKLFRTVRNGKGKTQRRAIGLFGEFGRLGLPQDGGTVQWKGRNRTFLVTRSRNLPMGGVLQRTGPKPSDVRVVWKFQKNVTLKARLGFRAVARATSDRWFREEMERQAVKAVQFNRGRS